MWFPVAYLNQISMIAVPLINHDSIKFHEQKKQQLNKYNDICYMFQLRRLHQKIVVVTTILTIRPLKLMKRQRPIYFSFTF